MGFTAAGYTASIQSVGNGWYRCSVTGTATAGLQYVYAYACDSTSTNTATTSGTSGIFIWGAQLNVGALQSYNPTTPKNLLGFTQEPENAAWTKSNSYVQQNLLTWSQGFDNAAWSKNNGGNWNAVTVTANQAIAPDGTLTADTVTAPATGSNGVLQQFACAANTTYTFSVWARDIDYGSFELIYSSQALPSTTFTTTPVSISTTTWTRVSITITTGAAQTTLAVGIGRNATSSSKSFYVWGAQLVQGSTAGDYTQTTSAAAPTRYTNWDGTLTGRKLVESATGGVHVVYASTAVAAVPYTLSMYAKPEERNFARLDFVTSSYAAGSTVILNLTTGVTTVTNYGATTGTTATAVSVGGGWYRLTMTVQATAATYFSQIGLSSTNSTGIYTGDGTSGIYVSDFQLANSASVDPYVYNPQAAAASAAYYGPRFDYDPVTLASRGLLIEEQRTNLLTYSEQFDNAVWNKSSNCTVTPNDTTAPDGATTADRIVISAANTISGPYNTVGTVSGLHTQSWYVKQAATVRYVQLLWTSTGVSSDYANFDLQTGTLTAGTYSGANIQNVGNGWYRISLTSTLAAVAGGCWILAINTSTAGRGASYPGTGAESFFAWGVQVEAGSFATSYIPTVASQVTRNADSASMLGDNFYTWYNPNQGTVSAEYVPSSLLSGSIAALNDGTFNNRTYLFLGSALAIPSLIVTAAGAVQANITNSAVAANTVAKTAGAYALNSFAVVTNAGTVATDVSGTLPGGLLRLDIGSYLGGTLLNGTIRRINYYNTRLDNATLQALTT